MPEGAFVRSIKALSFRAPPGTLRAQPETLRAPSGTFRTPPETLRTQPFSFARSPFPFARSRAPLRAARSLSHAALFLSHAARNPSRAARDGCTTLFSLLRKPYPATAVGNMDAQRDLGRNCGPPEAYVQGLRSASKCIGRFNVNFLKAHFCAGFFLLHADGFCPSAL